MATVTTSLSVDFATLLEPGNVATATKTQSQWTILGPAGSLTGLLLQSGVNGGAGDFVDGGQGTITGFQIGQLFADPLVTATGLSLSLEDFLAALAMPSGAQLATEYLFSQNDKITGNAGANLILGYGGDDKLTGDLGNDELSGGEGSDTLSGNDGDDTLIGGEGYDYLSGGGDNDNLNGGEGADYLDGEWGSDTLNGGEGNDSLFGGSGSGNDTLNGGEGSDYLYGGSGDDLLILGAKADALRSEDLDGGHGFDTLRVEGAVSTLALAIGAVERLEFTQGGSLTTSLASGFNEAGTTITVAGSAGKNAFVFNLLGEYPADWGYDEWDKPSAFHDFRGLVFESWAAEDSFVVNGSAASEAIFAPSIATVLNGGAGDDHIVGGALADRITGGSGADTLVGGKGNDTYVADSLDGILEKAGGGTDTVRAAGSFSLANWAQVEHLAVLNPASTNAANLTGNALANTLTGNSGVNKLSGGGGNDVLQGAKGKDVLIGGDGNDRFDFTTVPGSTQADTIRDMNERGNDTIRVDNAAFPGLKAGKLAASAFKVVTSPSAGVDASDRILFDQGDGKLYFDRDGSGTKYKPLLFAIVDPNIALTVSDFAVI
jgi:Ca2+-binding RTX toxin-like protein